MKKALAKDNRANYYKSLAMYHFIALHREEIKFRVVITFSDTTELNKTEEELITLFTPQFNYEGVDIPFRGVRREQKEEN